MAFDTLGSLLKEIPNYPSTSLQLCFMLIAAGLLLCPCLIILGKRRALSQAWWLLAPCALLLAGAYNELASYQQMTSDLATATQETQLKYTVRGIVNAIKGQMLTGLGLVAVSWMSAMSLAITHALRDDRLFRKWGAARAAGVGLLSAAALCATLLVRAHRPEMLMAVSACVVMLSTLPMVLVYLIEHKDRPAPGVCVTLLTALGLWGFAQVVLEAGRYQALGTLEKFGSSADHTLLTKALQLMNTDYTSVLTGGGVLLVLSVIALWLPSRTLRTSRGVLAIALVVVMTAAGMHIGATSLISEIDPMFLRVALGQ